MPRPLTRSRLLLAVAVLVAAFGGVGWAGERFAFLVAVGDYDRTELKPLKYTRRDITEFGKALVASGVREPNIVVMHDDPDKPPKARYLSLSSRIREELKLLLASLEADDSLIVAFAGHGVQFHGEKESWFCPNDARLGKRETLISFADVLKQLDDCPARQKLLLVDACRNEPQSELARSRSEVNLESVTRPQTIEVPKNLLAFFSCGPGQQSFEDPELKHGIFFYHVLKGYNGAADRDRDGKLDFTELQSYVRRETAEYARLSLKTVQTPQFKGEIANDWVLRTLGDSSRKLAAGERPGDEWSSNGLDLKLAWCPPGTFTMGSPKDEPDRSENEDQVTVMLSGFWMGAFEVTQSEWQRIMGTTLKEQAQRGTVDKRLVGEGARHPVYFVSYDEAVEFCRRLTTQERTAGRLPAAWEYRLPSEAEWEYACRAGTKTATAFGPTLSSQQANFDGDHPYHGAEKGPDLQGTCDVGAYEANAWGLHDMHGNVMEWCRDAYRRSLAAAPAASPGPEADRVCRGGVWLFDGKTARSACRRAGSTRARNALTGFRIVAAPVVK